MDWRVNNFDLIRLLAALQVAVVHALAACVFSRAYGRAWS